MSLAFGETWDVAVADPRTRHETLATFRVSGLDPARPQRFGLATSGTSVHRWVRDGLVSHHLIDPRTGRPAVSDIVQATVLAESATAAEAAAKTVVILGSGTLNGSWITRRSVPSCSSRTMAAPSRRRRSCGGWHEVPRVLLDHCARPVGPRRDRHRDRPWRDRTDGAPAARRPPDLAGRHGAVGLLPVARLHRVWGDRGVRDLRAAPVDQAPRCGRSPPDHVHPPPGPGRRGPRPRRNPRRPARPGPDRACVHRRARRSRSRRPTARCGSASGNSRSGSARPWWPASICAGGSASEPGGCSTTPRSWRSSARRPTASARGPTHRDRRAGSTSGRRSSSSSCSPTGSRSRPSAEARERLRPPRCFTDRPPTR